MKPQKYINIITLTGKVFDINLLSLRMFFCLKGYVLYQSLPLDVSNFD